jgi:hypothetical protein
VSKSLFHPPNRYAECGSRGPRQPADVASRASKQKGSEEAAACTSPLTRPPGVLGSLREETCPTWNRPRAAGRHSDGHGFCNTDPPRLTADSLHHLYCTSTVPGTGGRRLESHVLAARSSEPMPISLDMHQRQTERQQRSWRESSPHAAAAAPASADARQRIRICIVRRARHPYSSERGSSLPSSAL